MAFITRDKFLARPRKYVDVDVSEWFGEGESVRLWNITPRDRMHYVSALFKFTPGKDTPEIDVTGARARLLAYTIGDEQGNRLFTDGDEALIAERFEPDVFDALSAAADELTGLNATQDELRELFRQRLT